MVILTRSHQIYPVQYGLGLKVYREIGRGGNIFSTMKRFAIPVGKFLFKNVLKPFVKNNKQELKNIIQRLAAGRKRPASVMEDLKTNIQNILTSKSLSEHLRGEGLKRRRILDYN
jgi:hypothetical protein